MRTRGSGRWTFPKGSTEPGLTHAQAAALEAFEEAGVHGRIEEAAFARYRAAKALRSSAGTARKIVSVSAHLCEVVRLSVPKESDRDRTWFRQIEAKERLRKGRDDVDAVEFTRVVDKAVARIRRSREQSRHETQIAGIAGAPHPDSPVNARDGLQTVRFEASWDGWQRPADYLSKQRITPQPTSLAVSPARQLAGVIQMSSAAGQNSPAFSVDSGMQGQKKRIKNPAEGFKKV